MSEATVSSPNISLSASSWYLWRRVVSMTVLPIAFGAYFLYDWKVGYPAKKVQWQAYSEWQKEKSGPLEWKRIATERGWDEDPKEMTDEKIAEQLHWGVAVGSIGLILLAYYLLSYPKKLTADGESFTPPWGPRVRFDAVKKLDVRPWKHKGLCYAYYEPAAGQPLKKATLDDLRFPGAEEIMTRLMQNFDGEILELAPEEETPTEVEGDSSAAEATVAPASESPVVASLEPSKSLDSEIVATSQPRQTE